MDASTANNNAIVLLTPQQILSYNTAFADSLQKINNSVNHQAQTMTDLAVYIMKEVIALTDLAIQGADVKEAVTQFTENMQNKVSSYATPAIASVPEVSEAFNSNSWYTAMMHSLSLAQENAVAAQQQINISLQAATTMGVTTIYSVVTAAAADAAKKKLNPVNGSA